MTRGEPMLTRRTRSGGRGMWIALVVTLALAVVVMIAAMRIGGETGLSPGRGSLPELDSGVG